MSISYLAINGVRNLENVSLNLHEHYNFFIGPNGSGKTSLLESIYLLSMGRSFRTHLYNKVVHHQKENLTVFGRITDEQGENEIGVQKNKDGDTQIHINQQACRQSSSLAQFLPFQLYYSDSFKIIDSGPKVRREILDWGVFHVKHDYFKLYSQYERVLKQRNASLRLHQSTNAWDKMLSECAENIHQMRSEYFAQFLPICEKIITQFFGFSLTITYFKGWAHTHPTEEENKEPLLYFLDKDKDRDRKMGYTHHGPHKADIIIKHDNQLVKDFFSRGQQKLMIIAIKLAQGLLLSQLTNKKCVYLLDDLGAEFDEYHLSMVMSYLLEMAGQIFFTSTTEESFKKISVYKEFSKKGKTFHVKHGIIEEVFFINDLILASSTVYII